MLIIKCLFHAYRVYIDKILSLCLVSVWLNHIPYYNILQHHTSLDPLFHQHCNSNLENVVKCNIFKHEHSCFDCKTNPGVDTPQRPAFWPQLFVLSLKELPLLLEPPPEDKPVLWRGFPIHQRIWFLICLVKNKIEDIAFFPTSHTGSNSIVSGPICHSSNYVSTRGQIEWSEQRKPKRMR